MEKNYIFRPISTILDGTNYLIWAHQMQSFLFLIGRIVTGDISKLVKSASEDNGKFIKWLEDWNSKNHQIITWLDIHSC